MMLDIDPGLELCCLHSGVSQCSVCGRRRKNLPRLEWHRGQIW